MFSQYRFMHNEITDQRTEDIVLSYGTPQSFKQVSLPFWTEDVNMEHIGKREIYIENLQDGFCGPFTSYYVRHNNINTYLV